MYVSCCMVRVLFYVAQLSPIDTSLLQKKMFFFLLFHIKEKKKKTCEKMHSLDKQLTRQLTTYMLIRKKDNLWRLDFNILHSSSFFFSLLYYVYYIKVLVDNIVKVLFIHVWRQSTHADTKPYYYYTYYVVCIGIRIHNLRTYVHIRTYICIPYKNVHLIKKISNFLVFIFY